MIPTKSGSSLMSPEQKELRGNLKISLSQPNMKKPVGLGPLSLPSFQQSAFGSKSAVPPSSEEPAKLLLYKSAHSSGKLKLGALGEFDFKAEDLNDQGEIGRGAFGSVNKMVFSRNNATKVMAVKRIRSTVDEREQKELLMDLDVVMRSNDCQYIVQFFGAIFKVRSPFIFLCCPAGIPFSASMPSLNAL